MASDYQLIQLPNGAFSLRSERFGETLHPGVGPAVEGESLYVRQLGLRERVARATAPFVIWDVGLGAAANAMAVLRAVPGPRVHLISFDFTLDPLEFALAHANELQYLRGFEPQVERLLREGHAELDDLTWEVRLGNFPELIATDALPAPHAILYDAFSPAKNPEMWTQSLFVRLFARLSEPCSLATYSRSTMVRVGLLLAGFWVGVGSATGEKEETTIAANASDLIETLLDAHWLRRVQRSDSAEPLWDPVFRRAPLAPETLERLRAHPQFR